MKLDRIILALLFALGCCSWQPARWSVPALMPPHPRLREALASGEASLPAFMTSTTLKHSLGIDQPRANTPTALSGQIRALAVMVDFSDDVKTVQANFFDTLIFGAPGGAPTVRDYYSDISYGAIDIITVDLPSSLGWRRAPQTKAYYTYGGYCTDSAYPHNCQKLAEDILAAVNSVVDFSQYDNDRDGYAEPVMIVHSGPGAEYTDDASDIWSHSWSTTSYRYYDNTYVGDYVIMPEYWTTVSSASSDMTIGVFAHEMGHGFWNLPDLYDTDYTSQGIGDWSLMAGGSWNGADGDTPAWPDAWSRVQMGLVTPVPLTASQTGLSLPQPYNAAGAKVVYKLKLLVHSAQEYFLLENRQQASGTYDAALPGSGLLIWHIDERMAEYPALAPYGNDKECRSTPNYACGDNSHYLVALKQADAALQLELTYPPGGAGNGGDAGDPFPGTSNKRSWGSSGEPDSHSYYGTAAVPNCLAVTNISNSAATMTMDVSVCGAPAALTVSPVSQTSLGLAWNDTTGGVTPLTYKIERSANGTSGWTQIATTITTPSYTNTGLTCGTTYYYRVRANFRSDSAYSNVAPAATQACSSSVPAAPGSLAASPVSQTQVNLTWTDASSDETGFKVERSPDGTNGWVQIGTSAANAASYSDTGLTCGTRYSYRVRASNAAGDSAYSNVASTATVICAPAAPGSLAASPASQTQVNLTWTDASSSESGFKVERSPDGTNGWIQIGTTAANVVIYTDPGLTCGTTYFYRVRASNAAGDSAYSNIASAATQACSPSAPAAPSGLSASPASPTQINLAWTGADGSESGFKVERSLDGINNWTQIGTSPANTPGYKDIGLACGTTYFYRVRAWNAAGDSPYSGSASAATDACPILLPAAPTNLSAVWTVDRGVLLSWTAVAPLGDRVSHRAAVGDHLGGTGWGHDRSDQLLRCGGHARRDLSVSHPGLPQGR